MYTVKSINVTNIEKQLVYFYKALNGVYDTVAVHFSHLDISKGSGRNIIHN